MFDGNENEITNKQFDIIFSNAKENLAQYTFFGADKSWNKPTSQAPLGVKKGNIFSSIENITVTNKINRLFGYFNISNNSGTSFGEKITKFKTNPRYGNTNEQNIKNAWAPYDR